MGNTTVRYADDKPKDCKYCYFWGGRVKGCTLGGVENCHYLIKEKEVPVKKTKCDDCPYKKMRTVYWLVYERYFAEKGGQP